MPFTKSYHYPTGIILMLRDPNIMLQCKSSAANRVNRIVAVSLMV